jgi:hypothetical protein
VSGVERWQANWRAVSPPGGVRVDVPRSAAARSALQRRLAALEPGAPLVLCASGPGARRRCRRLARVAGIALERHYLAFPGAAPAYLVEDHPASAELFARNVLAAPPSSALAAPADSVAALVRRAGAGRILRMLAPGHVAVGRRR